MAARPATPHDKATGSDILGAALVVVLRSEESLDADQGLFLDGIANIAARVRENGRNLPSRFLVTDMLLPTKDTPVILRTTGLSSSTQLREHLEIPRDRVVDFERGLVNSGGSTSHTKVGYQVDLPLMPTPVPINHPFFDRPTAPRLPNMRPFSELLTLSGTASPDHSSPSSCLKRRLNGLSYTSLHPTVSLLLALVDIHQDRGSLGTFFLIRLILTFDHEATMLHHDDWLSTDVFAVAVRQLVGTRAFLDLEQALRPIFALGSTKVAECVEWELACPGQMESKARIERNYLAVFQRVQMLLKATAEGLQDRRDRGVSHPPPIQGGMNRRRLERHQLKTPESQDPLYLEQLERLRRIDAERAQPSSDDAPSRRRDRFVARSQGAFRVARDAVLRRR
ncbi:hypothetical protein JCM10207_007984 [Rhodosporidiobolus poonsookiae]